VNLFYNRLGSDLSENEPTLEGWPNALEQLPTNKRMKMFTRENVTLRPLEPADIDTLYVWEMDHTLSYFAGWVSRMSRCAFKQFWEKRLNEPPDNLVVLGIEVEQRLVGYIQLGLIDRDEQRAAIGIVVGEQAMQGKGIGSMAVRILCDFAFTVKGLERVYAESYAYNTRAHRMFERAGFQREGVLRKHERHNGLRQDLHVFGMLRDEFYAHNETIFHPNV
jgi:RimJ/RimL family protein N-acetyltransferase